MTDLGAALRRAGCRVESREIVRPTLDLAHRCGARPHARRASPRRARRRRRPTPTARTHRARGPNPERASRCTARRRRFLQP
jgi:hypothetical protein